MDRKKGRRPLNGGGGGRKAGGRGGSSSSSRNRKRKSDNRCQHQNQPESNRECTLCQKTSTSLQKCSKCKSVAYCSSKCRENDYKKHNQECRKLQVLLTNHKNKEEQRKIPQVLKRVLEKAEKGESSPPTIATTDATDTGIGEWAEVSALKRSSHNPTRPAKSDLSEVQQGTTVLPMNKNVGSFGAFLDDDYVDEDVTELILPTREAESQEAAAQETKVHDGASRSRRPQKKVREGQKPPNIVVDDNSLKPTHETQGVKTPISHERRASQEKVSCTAVPKSSSQAKVQPEKVALKKKKRDSAAERKYKKFASALAGQSEGNSKPAKPKAVSSKKGFNPNKAYNKFAEALAEPTDIEERMSLRYESPEPLPLPTKPGRTVLGDKPPNDLVLSELMKTDIVLHYRPDSIMKPEYHQELIEFTGVYEPTDELDLHGFPSYSLSKLKTYKLCTRLAKCKDETKIRLINKRVFLQGSHRSQPKVLYRFAEKDRSGWTACDLQPDKHVSPFIISLYPYGSGELNYWTDRESLFRANSNPFLQWQMTRPSTGGNFEVHMAMTSMKMFNRAIEVANMPLPAPNIIEPLASDFYFWNTPMVLHAKIDTDPILKRQLDPWMGVYRTTDHILQGYPIWELDVASTSELMHSVSDANAQHHLSELGMALIPCAVDSSAKKIVMYVFRHVVHVGPESGPRGQEYYLRGFGASEAEEYLLSESDSLFRFGAKAFSAWSVQSEIGWTQVSVAITPEPFFRETILLASLELKMRRGSKLNDEANPASDIMTESETKNKNKKKRKKKKKKNKQIPVPSANRIATNEAEDTEKGDQAISTPGVGPDKSFEREKVIVGSDETGRRTFQLEEQQCDIESVQLHCETLRKRLGIDVSKLKKETRDQNFEDSLKFIFQWTGEAGFLEIEERLACSFFEATLNADDVSYETQDWLRSQTETLMITSINHGRKALIVSMLKTGVSISVKCLSNVFWKLPKDRSDEYNNAIAKSIRRIQVVSRDEISPLSKLVSCRVGKQAKKNFFAVLKEGEAAMKITLQSIRTSTTSPIATKRAPWQDNAEIGHAMINDASHQSEDGNGGDESQLESALSNLRSRVDFSLSFYRDMLDRIVNHTSCDDSKPAIYDREAANTREQDTGSRTGEETDVTEKEELALLSSEEAAEEIARCFELPEKRQAEIVSNVEKCMDLFNWDDDSVWTIDITEQAHKWFRKHVKREFALCDRVIRRLKLLSVGRWPYALCKPLKTKRQAVRLYESKIDSASRIIWEVAVSFSPRRSRPNHSYCEQVIRVWDVVQDHDNLSRSIDRAVERIELSHERGQECLIFSELESLKTHAELVPSRATSGSKQFLPQVFTMRGVECHSQGLTGTGQKDGRHYPPASDDPRQFTLLKFYELNTAAIKLLLDAKDENADLPFTPGPKEHEIIHYTSDPPKSILLMGRSGTGKTTCLVFRMWAQFMAYDNERDRPRQLFVTKNDVLRKEVQKSFLNMGLAWRRKASRTNGTIPDQPDSDSTCPTSTDRGERFPLFLTASRWLELLDGELPGTSFFTELEVEDRVTCRDQDDAVKRGVEALFAEDNEAASEKSKEVVREEMTYVIFRKKWKKINSKVKSSIDPALVWLEIKSFIKGSVEALRINDDGRNLRCNRFLTRAEYLSLPKKRSRTDDSQRREVYDLFESYERIKRSGNYFDEMDLVYNLAGRVEQFLNQASLNIHPDIRGLLLPIDSLFVDEVQDFTQAELYLLTKLNRDPNNLFLAGDTAQSIAVGVGFRFTDVRQIFYNSFGGIEPSLLQLTFNFRSHAGVLRLAATVVELLYFFFSDGIDRLPPDLGLFTGPQPVIMEAQNPDELVLMLDGSKRETSRIEFGSHQVVIVRSEEAKSSLPDEFGVDKDWVMTVQESKGLEFDDVLLYNFFSDSIAGDMWRVVSNYTEADICAYYEDASVKSSGVQIYDWDRLLDSKTRDLGFSYEEHKILETELKMLYTAITRARVNVFIAERDVELARPMFEYFTRRRVVEVANNRKREGIRVFGKMNTIKDWRERGEYYLENASGQRKKGCLRLASKCFEKAGEESRKNYALAFLSFVEIEEEQEGAILKRRDKQNIARRQRLYAIAARLLEAKDLIFLDKAALCLLQADDSERPRSAEMFELYARLRYSERMTKNSRHVQRPSTHERQYFSYAGKLYAGCASMQQISHRDRREFLVRGFRNLLRSGSKSDLEQAAMLIESNLQSSRKDFAKLASMCTPCEENRNDPLAHYQTEIHNSKDGVVVRQALEKLAKISCRFFYSDDDTKGMRAALEIIPPSEKIPVLHSLESDPKRFIQATPWAGHSAFSSVIGLPTDKNDNSPTMMDVTNMLVKELLLQDNHQRASEILETRGQLLKAADILILLADNTENSPARTRLAGKIADLKARYVELILQCQAWEKNFGDLCSIIESAESFLSGLSRSLVPDTLLMSIGMSKAKLEMGDSHITHSLCDGHVLWQCDSIMQAVSNSRVGFKHFFSKLPSNNVWDGVSYVTNCAREIEEAATILLRPTSNKRNETSSIISQVESYFGLSQYQLNPKRVSAFSATNLKLLQAVQECRKYIEISNLDLPDWTDKLVLVFDREHIHSVLAHSLYNKASGLLLLVEKYLKEEETKCCPCDSSRFGTKCHNGSKCKQSHGPLAKTTKNHISLLQAHLFCLEHVRMLRNKAELEFPKHPLCAKLKKCEHDSQSLVSEKLRRYILETNQLSFHETQYMDIAQIAAKHGVLLQPSVLKILETNAHHRWYKSSSYQKKEPITVIRYWKMLRLCDRTGDAKMKIESELENVKKKWANKDIRDNTTDAYIDKKVANLRDAELFSRLWIYTIDSADEDLFKSMHLIENLIELNSTRDSVKLMSMIDQIMLLEVISVGIFGAISLRYGESPMRETCSFLIPEYSYMNCFLSGNSSTDYRTFGVDMKNAISSACHNKENYFDFFSKCIEHLEHLALTIIENELLSKPKSDQVEDLGRFERAIVLGVFVSCNAVLLSIIGEEMSAEDVKEDLNKFPSIPLCGNIKRTVRILREAFLVCTSLPSTRLQNVFKKLPTNSTFLDIVLASNRLLSDAGWSDKIVLCRLKQSLDHEVEIDSDHDIGLVERYIGRIPFDERRGVFAENYKPKLKAFIDQKELRGARTNQKDISMFSKKSEGRKASIIICRFLQSKHRKSKLHSKSSRSYFHSWKRVICSFVSITKRHMSEKLAKANLALGETVHDLETTKQDIACPLSAIPNRLKESDHLQRFNAKWMQLFVDYYSPVFDGIECAFCGVVYEFAHQKKLERDAWVYAYSPQFYKVGCVQFNYNQFGMPDAPFDTSYMGHIYIQHQYENTHQCNVNAWTANINVLAEVAAGLETALDMMASVKKACEFYKSRHQHIRHEISSFYYKVEEEAMMSFAQLQDAQFRLSREALVWPLPQSFQVLVASFKASCRHAETFVSRVQEEENQLFQNDRCDEDDDKTGTMDNGIGALEDDFFIR